MCGWLGVEIDFGAVNQSNVFGYFVNQFGDSPPGHKGKQPKSLLVMLSMESRGVTERVGLLSFSSSFSLAPPAILLFFLELFRELIQRKDQSVRRVYNKVLKSSSSRRD